MRQVAEAATSPLDASSVLDAEPMPVAVIKEEALRHNIATFAAYCERHGVELAPHVKTTMSPEIFSMQHDAGAWAATVANAPQARSVRAWGVDRILIANELVDAASLRWLIAEHEADEAVAIYFWVDSREGIEAASHVHGELGAERPLRVLVEVGHPGGRTGCRSAGAASELASRVAATPQLELSGISGFEGTISRDSPEENKAAVGEFLAEMRAAYDAVADQGLFEVERPLLTAGGSAYFDRVVEVLAGATGARTILRSGCYVTHDCGSYDRLSPMGGASGILRSAIEVWGLVLSVPEPSLALLGIGKRDASDDAGLPVPTRWRPGGGRPQSAPDGVEVTSLNDQHAYLRDPTGRLAVGDLVGCCISHPCTTFDKWRTLHLVDEEYLPVRPLSTFF